MTEEPAQRATRLTNERITELREQARREAGPFVDPCLVPRIKAHNPEWASEILGHEFLGEERLSWSKLYLIHLACQAEPDPPPPPRATARRGEIEAERQYLLAEEQRRYARQLDRWQRAVRKLADRGVRAEVRHNYTSTRHEEWYVQGKDHVYLLDDLEVGRLTRGRGRVLCWTPSRARDLREFPEPAGDSRLPTCKACLKTLVRVTGIDLHQGEGKQ